MPVLSNQKGGHLNHPFMDFRDDFIRVENIQKVNIPRQYLSGYSLVLSGLLGVGRSFGLLSELFQIFTRFEELVDQIHNFIGVSNSVCLCTFFPISAIMVFVDVTKRMLTTHVRFTRIGRVRMTTPCHSYTLSFRRRTNQVTGL